MFWIDANKKQPTKYKPVILFFNNGLICDGFYTDEGIEIDRHIQMKHFVSSDPEEIKLVYWCDMPSFNEK